MPVEPSEPGVRRCLGCDWLFVSPDVIRIARCADCRDREDPYVPKTGTVSLPDGAGKPTAPDLF